jgi:two-component system, OmpR family, sensor histidine kinase CreC
VFERFYARDVDALISGVHKPRVRQRVYVTNSLGKVVFDSTGEALGEDYSRWNNVKLTLKGKYGARSSHVGGPKGPSIMHVSAPIRKGGVVVGVVTVAKVSADLDPFVERARGSMLRTGAAGLLVSLGVGLLLSWLLSRSVARLVTYARVTAAGKRTVVPEVGGELSVLADAMESMREKLEGKQYVEHAMQTFAHEMKSPLATILASSELLEGDLPPEDRLRFAKQVSEEATRMQDLLERLLELAVVEQRQALKDPQAVPLAALFANVIELHKKDAEQRKVTFRVEVADSASAWGEVALLRHAASNLIANAIAFAEHGSLVTVLRTGESVRIHNRGPAIPSFAQARLFERFYSLPRPSTGKRSSGLGLAFVQEVTQLHGGSIELKSEDEGVTVIWCLPAARVAK